METKDTKFKATHRYNGEDGFVPFFSEGEEVMYVGDPEGYSPDFVALNGEYINANGTEQIVLKSCMEAI